MSGMASAAAAATTSTGLPKPSFAIATQTGQILCPGSTLPTGCTVTTRELPHKRAADPGKDVAPAPDAAAAMDAFR